MGSCSVETGAQEAPQPGGPGSAWTGKGPVSNFPDAGQVLSAVLSRTLASPPAHKPPKAPAGLGLACAEVGTQLPQDGLGKRLTWAFPRRGWCRQLRTRPAQYPSEASCVWRRVNDGGPSVCWAALVPGSM